MGLFRGRAPPGRDLHHGTVGHGLEDGFDVGGVGLGFEVRAVRFGGVAAFGVGEHELEVVPE